MLNVEWRIIVGLSRNVSLLLLLLFTSQYLATGQKSTQQVTHEVTGGFSRCCHVAEVGDVMKRCEDGSLAPDRLACACWVFAPGVSCSFETASSTAAVATRQPLWERPVLLASPPAAGLCKAAASSFCSRSCCWYLNATPNKACRQYKVHAGRWNQPQAMMDFLQYKMHTVPAGPSSIHGLHAILAWPDWAAAAIFLSVLRAAAMWCQISLASTMTGHMQA